MKRVENFKYYYKQATKPVTLVSLAVGFVGVLIGAAGLFAGAYYKQLYQKAVAEKQVAAGTVLHAEGDLTSPLQQNTGLYPVAYQVAEGDSLWKIAEQFYGDGNLYTFLAKENGITTPNYLAVGTEISIPTPPQEKEAMGLNQGNAEKQADSYQTSSDNIVKSSITTDSASSSERENSEHFEYIVECGDSLWFIALKYHGNGYAWTELYQNNKEVLGSNPNLIFPGTKLDL